MIKNIIVYMYFVFSVTSFTSCDKRISPISLLEKAEMLMEEHPDSSLVILQEIENTHTLSKKDYALWCLLLTQANEKNYINHSSDSLIKISIDYYMNEDNKEYLMKSYYYTAVIYHDLGDSPHAQEFYLKTLDLARELESNDFLGRAYANLGSIYINLDLYEEAINCERKALKEFTLLNDSTNIGIVLRNLGWICAENSRPDSGIVYYEKALSYVESDHAYIFNEIGSIYKHIANYEKAFYYTRLAQNTISSNYDLTPMLHNLGSLYQLTDQRDSAMFYLTQCTLSLNPYTKMGAYLSLSYLETQQKNWEAVADYQQQYIQINDSLLKNTRIEKLQHIQSLFNYQQIEKERFYYKQLINQKRIQLYQISIAFFFISILFLLLILYYKKIKQQEQQKNEKTLRIELQKHLQTQEYLKENEKKINRMEGLMHLYSEKYNLPQKDSEQFYLSPLYKKILRADINITEAEWDELSTWCDILFPGFSERLKVLYPTIGSSELKLCYLKKIDIPVKKIANLLFMTSQGVSHKWKRLYTKITGCKGSTTDMDLFIADL